MKKFLGMVAGSFLVALLFLVPVRATTTTNQLVGGTWTPLVPPWLDEGLGITIPTVVSGNIIIAGVYYGNEYHGFLYDGTTWTTLVAPWPTSQINPKGISGNSMVGIYADNFGHYPFLYDGTTWVTSTFFALHAPDGAHRIFPLGLSGNRIIGVFTDTQETERGFLLDGETWTTLPFRPLSISGNNIFGGYIGRYVIFDGQSTTELDLGLGIWGSISGNYIVGYSDNADASGIHHGLVYDLSSHTRFYLDAQAVLEDSGCDGIFMCHRSTVLNSISGNQIVGTYSTSAGIFPFLYTMQPTQPTPTLSFPTDYPNGLATSTFNYPEKPVFKVLYSGTNDSVGQVNVVVDTISYPMVKGLDLLDNPYYYWSPANAFSTGTHSYHFEASDGARVVKVPESGEMSFQVIDSRVTIRVGVILADLYGGPNHISTAISKTPCKLLPNEAYPDGHSVKYYEDIFYCVNDYYQENSYGKVNFQFSIITSTAYANNGYWFSFTNPTSTESYYSQNRLDLAYDAVSAAELSTSEQNNYDVIVVVHSGFSKKYKEDNSRIGTGTEIIDTKGGIFSHVGGYPLVIAEYDSVGTWAHELGHMAGMVLTPEHTFMPDLYNMGNVGKWDLMAMGSWDGGPFDIWGILGDGSDPAYMSSYTRIFFGWLGQDIHKKSDYGYHNITSLEASKYGDKVFRYNLEDNNSTSTKKYYLVEARDSGQNAWDTTLPGMSSQHLLTYYVDERGKDLYGYDSQGYLKGAGRLISLPIVSSTFSWFSRPAQLTAYESHADLNNMVAFYNLGQSQANADQTIINIEPLNNIDFNSTYSGTVYVPNGAFSEMIASSTYSLNQSWVNNLALSSPCRTPLFIPLSNLDHSVIFPAMTKSIYIFSFLIITFGFIGLTVRKIKSKSKFFIWIFLGVLCLGIMFVVFRVMVSIIEDDKCTTELLKKGPGFDLDQSNQNLILPTLDLHLHCPDGRHIGMNYQIGEFENQIPNSIVSGPMGGAPEWIFVPATTTGCHYSVSAHNAEQFLSDHPEIAAQISTTTDSYDIYSRYIDPQAGIFTSQTLTNQTIEPGQDIVHEVSGTSDVSVTPGVVDNQPPTITNSPVEFQYYLNASSTQFTFHATDAGVGVSNVSTTLDGTPISSPTILSFDQSKLGNHTIVITASDFAGNNATTTIHYNVGYKFNGFQAPIKSDGSGIYNLGRTLPVKFSLTDVGGNQATSAVAHLVVTNVENGLLGTIPVTLGTSANDTGDLFRVSGNQYIYNLNTGQLSSGTWQIKVVLDDGKSYSVLISLR